MPFLIVVGLAAFALPLVMMMTRMRAEVIVAFAAGIVVAVVFQRFSLALLVNAGGWLLTLLSFVPGFWPGRWLRRKPAVKGL